MHDRLEAGRHLHHAHLAGVVHRDVKPANVIVRRDDVELTDFGLGRYGNPKLTQAGAMIGTPCYMSPEQIRADPAQIGPKADQYGLGVLLYELLCGELPFVGPTAESRVSRGYLLDAPRSPIEFNASIPSGLADLCPQGPRQEARRPLARLRRNSSQPPVLADGGID